ncbi:hypothetical protein KEM55_002672, partial [Ascosphaera atra]
FMIEGFENDDLFIMVEDEFLQTAQLFTRHLHQAEYDRIKGKLEEEKAAKSGEAHRGLAGVGERDEEKRKVLEHGLREQLLQTRPSRGTTARQVDGDANDTRNDLWTGNALHSLMTRPTMPRSLLGVHGGSQTPSPRKLRGSPQQQQQLLGRGTETAGRSGSTIGADEADAPSTASETEAKDEHERTPSEKELVTPARPPASAVNAKKLTDELDDDDDFFPTLKESRTMIRPTHERKPAHRPSYPASSTRSGAALDDDITFEDTEDPATAEKTGTALSTRRESLHERHKRRKQKEEEEEEKRKARLSEIPLFLV